MADKTILILGGYGSAGRAIARLLCEWTDAQLILAGRRQAKAVETAAELNALFPDFRVSGIQVDAAKADDLRRALAGIDLLIVASSTTRYAREVASAALEAQVDYLDIQYSTTKLRTLETLAGDIEAAGRCFITDGGFHPGLPAALVRYADTRFDHLERAVVGCALRVDWKGYQVGDSTAAEFVSEMRDYQLLFFREGEWRRARLWRSRDFLTLDYGKPFGRVSALPMLLGEMRALPDMIPALRDTGFYITGFNWFVDWVIFPLGMLALRLVPRSARLVGRLTFWGMRTFSRPPYGIVLQLEARGERKGEPESLRVRVSHEDGYVLTAAPTVACIRQYLDGGEAARPGLHFMAHIMEPVRMMEDLERMGVEVQVQVNP